MKQSDPERGFLNQGPASSPLTFTSLVFEVAIIILILWGSWGTEWLSILLKVTQLSLVTYKMQTQIFLPL